MSWVRLLLPPSGGDVVGPRIGRAEAWQAAGPVRGPGFTGAPCFPADAGHVNEGPA